ncbi:cupin domain-containing protein [Streptomyces sp. NPDC048211]|uniref:cupin domain-containing protein n=1 Tax=Streptomyces sp. NPDC048211 TaxID=3365516 RepID=UPI00371E250E
MTTHIGLVSQSLSLDYLLNPVTAAEFLCAHWEKEPLLINRNDVEYYASLPGLDDIEELITTTSTGMVRSTQDVSAIRSDRNGTLSKLDIPLNANGIPDIQGAYRAYSDGYTIVVNGVHRRSAAIAGLSRSLERTLHHPIGANLYLTPLDGQGFSPHVDTHDVFILQLHGSKEWHVGSPSTDLPLVSAGHGPLELTDFRKFTLNPGDTLYLPRGFPHEALTSNSSSLHLTIGIHAYRWLDFMVEALGVLAEEDIHFRKALPPGFLDSSLMAQVPELVNRLAASLKKDFPTERAKVRLAAKLLRKPMAAGSGHFRSLDLISSLTEESVVVRSSDLLCRVRADSDEVLIEFATNFVSGPLFLESTFKFVAEHERFTVRELTGELSTEDKIDIVSRLISEGLLQCVERNQEGDK